jgi:HTH-type transcriptional regulator/antitoxin HigA
MEVMRTTKIDERKYVRLLGKTVPVVIETKEEYERMLAGIEDLMDRDDKDITPEDGRLLKLLAMLVQEYEDRNVELPKSKPHKMLKYLLEERGLNPIDLWPIVGLKSRVSEILAGKRSISKHQAKKLAAFLHVPVDLFI